MASLAWLGGGVGVGGGGMGGGRQAQHVGRGGGGGELSLSAPDLDHSYPLSTCLLSSTRLWGLGQRKGVGEPGG